MNNYDDPDYDDPADREAERTREVMGEPFEEGVKRIQEMWILPSLERKMQEAEEEMKKAEREAKRVTTATVIRRAILWGIGGLLQGGVFGGALDSSWPRSVSGWTVKSRPNVAPLQDR